MDRLTMTQEEHKRDGLGPLKYLSPAMCAEYDKRLAAYEDTGLAPDEIVAMREELAALKTEKSAVRNPEVAPVTGIPATGNRVLTLDEVLALPEGARVWVEHTKGWGESRLYAKHNEWRGSDVALVDERGEYWDVCIQRPETAFGKLYRVWSRPVEPTPEEIERWPWEEGGHNA